VDERVKNDVPVTPKKQQSLPQKVRNVHVIIICDCSSPQKSIIDNQKRIAHEDLKQINDEDTNEPTIITRLPLIMALQIHKPTKVAQELPGNRSIVQNVMERDENNSDKDATGATPNERLMNVELAPNPPTSSNLSEEHVVIRFFV